MSFFCHIPPTARAIATVVAIAACTPSPGAAEDVQTVSVYGTDLNLPLPNGHCALSKRHAADRTAISLIEKVNRGNNKLLLMFAECSQLEAFRTEGRDLANYGSYLAPNAARKPVRMPRARFVEIISAQFEKQRAAIEKAQEEAKRRVKATGTGTEIQENVNLGLIHRDSNAAYTGLLQSWRQERAAAARIAVVTALTLAQDRVISINLSAPHAGKETVATLLGEQQQLVRDVIARN